MKENEFFIWEERNLIEPKKNLEIKEMFVLNDGIKETKDEFVRNECEGIGNKKICKRNCPKCGKEKIYTHRGKYNRDIKINRLCRNCWKIRGAKFRGPFERKCPECKKKIVYSRKYSLDRANKQNRLCNFCKFKEERSCWYGTNGGMFGKHHNEETKKKIRIKAIERIVLRCGKCSPNYNPDACKYFDKLSKEKGWNLQHAENGGEYYIKNLGYWLDGYDKEKNIVVEYDEYYHRWSSVKKRDINRQTQIKNLFNCKFYRYNVEKDLLYEVL
jgi:endogenous inhibitor of DNA gyrase (YacG/DUF329 family)